VPPLRHRGNVDRELLGLLPPGPQAPLVASGPLDQRRVPVVAHRPHVLAPGPHRGHDELLQLGNVGRPAGVTEPRSDRRLLEGGQQRPDVRVVRQAVDRHPLDHGRLAAAVRVDALQQEQRRADIRDDHRRLVAAEADQHLVDQPLDHRMLAGEVQHLRPQRVGALPGPSQHLLGDVPVCGEPQPLQYPLLGQVALREHLQPPGQVPGGHEADQPMLRLPPDVQLGLRVVKRLPERLVQERLVRAEQAGRVHGPDRLAAGLTGQHHHQVEPLARLAGDDLVEGPALGDRPSDLVLLLGGRVEAHERAGVAERAVRLVLLVKQPREHTEVPLDIRMAGGEQERADLRALALAVAVDAPVALLDGDEAPRQVEMDQLVALPVQVHAFGSDVAGE